MKKIFTILLISTGIFSAKANIIGSDPLVATIDENMVITLPADQPLATSYVLDISSLNIVSDEVLQSFCTNFGDRNMVLKGNFTDKKIIVEVAAFKDSTGSIWDVAKWNQYLAQRAPKMHVFMQSMNK